MAFSDPQKIVQTLPLREGSRVADFGAGSGYYALALARRVGSNGRVYAVDIQKDLLARLKSAARAQGVGNLEVVWGDIDEPKGSRLSPDSMDAVVLANVFFQLEHRNEAVKEVLRVLKPGARVLVVDWRGSFGDMGPASRDVLLPEHARELFEREGFMFEKDIGALAGDHHYGLIFSKPQS